MLELPGVTLACVDTRTPGLALEAMHRCMDQIRFGDAVLFTDLRQVCATPPGVRLVPIEIDSVPAYSRFMLQGLNAHITTSHVLVVQWDGYVLDAAQWDSRFLEFDYIGALWREWSGDAAVGNGGFSLRSKRLLAALLEPGMAVRNPEDLCICHDNRDRLEREFGIRFAPREVAARFAVERVASPGPTFGFHGLFNMPAALDDGALLRLVRSLPDDMLRGLDARDLCRWLVDARRFDLASVILHKRRRAGVSVGRTLRWRQRFALLWAHGLSAIGRRKSLRP